MAAMNQNQENLAMKIENEAEKRVKELRDKTDEEISKLNILLQES